MKREGETDGHVVVLLHGFGADANDLFPLADVLDPEEQWTFIAPRAPLEVPIGPGWTGRGWFPISVRDLERGVDFTQVRPPGLDLSAEMVSELVFELNAEKLVLAGFSQGAMITTEVAMNMASDVDAFALWSGVLLDEAGWKKRASVLKGKPFLQSHGTADSVLPIGAAQRLFELLKSAGAEGQFVQFGGAHEIPMNVIQKTAALLKQRLNG